MTTLEIILIVLLWLIVGLFLASKRDWYAEIGENSEWFCFFAVLFAPLNLIITFIRVFCVEKWDNSKY